MSRKMPLGSVLAERSMQLSSDCTNCRTAATANLRPEIGGSKVLCACRDVVLLERIRRIAASALKEPKNRFVALPGWSMMCRMRARTQRPPMVLQFAANQLRFRCVDWRLRKPPKRSGKLLRRTWRHSRPKSNPSGSHDGRAKHANESPWAESQL